MVNVYTQYFKELMDFLYGAVSSNVSDSESIKLKYSFDDYEAKVGQQLQLIESLVSAGVLEIVREIPPSPIAKINMQTVGNKYSVAGCAGYELGLNKRQFLKYRKENPVIKVLEDEHELMPPFLKDDGETLAMWDRDIPLRKGTSKTQGLVLAQLVFGNDDLSCRVDDFLVEYYGETEADNNRSKMKTVLNNFNKMVGKEQLLKQVDGLIVYDGPGSPNREKLYN